MTGLNSIVDLSHHNGNVDLQQAQASGILGIIHKATQGTSYVDPMYQQNRAKAAQVGLLWGAYHFGTGDDTAQQVEHFLSTVQPTQYDLLVLDFENNPSGTSMSLEQAVAFVSEVQSRTGRWPGLYSGSAIKALLGSGHNAALAQCWFWLAEYGPTARVPANWPTWTMWQYTDGTIGPEPHSVPGIGNCDRDTFNGSEEQLRKLWGYTTAPALQTTA